MILLLRCFAILVLVSMLVVTGWASSVQALWKIPAEVVQNPWFIATLFDAYFGFLFFWLWVVYKERGWGARLGWLVGILLLGNIAMAIYVLIQTFKVGKEGSIGDLLGRRHV